MRSFGVVLVGENMILTAGYRLSDTGVSRTFGETNQPVDGNLVGTILEVMLKWDAMVKGEWQVLLVETLFAKNENFARLLGELNKALGRSYVQVLMENEAWQELLDWQAVQYFSDRVVVNS